MLGILPGVIGCIQATETIKLILGIGEPLIGRLLHYDALEHDVQDVQDPPRPEVGGRRPAPDDQGADRLRAVLRRPRRGGTRSRRSGGEITPEQLKKRIDAGENLFVLDVRNPNEFQICRIPGTVLVPLPELPARLAEVPKDREVIVHCKSGMAEPRRSSS